MTSLPKPSRFTLIALVLTGWEILVSGLRIYAWNSLKEGFIQVRPLARTARVLVLSALALVIFFLVSILFNEFLRVNGPLEPLPLQSGAARALFVPSSAVPLTYFAIALGWAFLLTGALHVYWPVRWGIWLTFLVFCVPELLIGSLQVVSLGRPEMTPVSAGLTFAFVLMLLVAFFYLPRKQLPLAYEFSAMFLVVGGLLFMAWLLAAEATAQTGMDSLNGYLLPSLVTTLRILIIPFLFIAGSEMVNFGISAAGWATQSTQRVAAGWAILALLFVLLAYRVVTITFQSFGQGFAMAPWLAWGGALLSGAILVPLALWRQARPERDSVPGRLVIALILLLIAVQLLLVPVTSLAVAIFAIVAASLEELAGVYGVIAQIGTISNLYQSVFLLLAAAAGLVTAFIAYRRKRYTVAAFGMILAWTQGLWWLMEDGRPLEPLRYSYSEMDVLLTLAIAALAVYWFARRALTPERTLRLFGLAFFAWLLNNTNFIDNPFSVLFGFAGVFFLVFSLSWSVLTAGRFANTASPRFPRVNRLLLYLGYVLITVSVSHWIVVTHNVEQQTLSNEINFSGYRIFGLTIAYLMFVEGGRALLKSQEE